MKGILYILIILLPLMVNSQNSFQPLSEADWTLWDRHDHKMHMFVGQITSWTPILVITYLDEDNPDFKKGLKYSIPISLGLTLGKELLWDRVLGLGTPTFPDLVYGITGTITGVIFSWGLYKLERVHVNKHEKLKL